MSLINQMLIDLEARGQLPRIDRALTGLAPAAVIRRRNTVPWVLASASVCALIVGWALRQPNFSGPLFTAPLERELPLPLMPEAPRESGPVSITTLEQVVPRVLPVETAPVIVELAPVIPAPAANVKSPPGAMRDPPAAEPPRNAVAQTPTDITEELRNVARAIEAAPSSDPITPAAVARNSAPVEMPGTFRREPAAGVSVGREIELQRALNLIDAGRVERGASALRAYLIEHPDAHAARLTFAQTLIKLGRGAAAAITLRSGLARAPKHVGFARLLGHLLYDKGDPSGALRVLRAAAPAVREHLDYHAFMAALEQRAGNHGAAIATYREIVAVHPRDGAAWIGIGISLSAQRDSKQAIAAFENAQRDSTLSPAMQAYARAEISRLARQ
ncbi:MAG: tetratricopeptide repeat protein [Gammaproteobacteria bacterium]